MPVDVGAFEALGEGRATIFRHGGREVGIIRWGERVFAVRNRCPHMGGPLCRGLVGPQVIGADAGSIVADYDRPMVVCPWHGWAFDVETGTAVVGHPHDRVKSYRAWVENGRVLVELGRE